MCSFLDNFFCLSIRCEYMGFNILFLLCWDCLLKRLEGMLSMNFFNVELLHELCVHSTKNVYLFHQFCHGLFCMDVCVLNIWGFFSWPPTRKNSRLILQTLFFQLWGEIILDVKYFEMSLILAQGCTQMGFAVVLCCNTHKCRQLLLFFVEKGLNRLVIFIVHMWFFWERFYMFYVYFWCYLIENRLIWDLINGVHEPFNKYSVLLLDHKNWDMNFSLSVYLQFLACCFWFYVGTSDLQQLNSQYHSFVHSSISHSTISTALE